MSDLEIAKLFNNAFGPVVGTIFSVVVLFLGGKFIKPNLVGAGAQAELIKDLSENSDKWQKMYEETHEQNKLLEKQLHEAENHTTLLRMNAQMMYRLLERHGVPEEDLKMFDWLKAYPAVEASDEK